MGNRNKTNDPIELYTGVGVALGLIFGTAFDDVGVGLVLGVAIGAGIGTILNQKNSLTSRSRIRY